MLKNYLKIVLRNLWRHKVFSLINIFGLSMGLSCTFLLYLYIQHKLSYDNFHQDAESIYMVQTTMTSDNETEEFIYTMGGVAEALQKDYPEVLAASRIRGWGGLLSYKNNKLSSDELLYVDEPFFDILSYNFLYGNPKEALKNPKSIILTETLAKKLFGDASLAFQQTLSFDNESLLVTGVIENIPDNTSLTFEGVMPISVLPEEQLRDMGAAGWLGIGCQTIVRLQNNTDYLSFNEKLPALQQYYQDSEEKYGFKLSMGIVPFSYLHLYDFGEGSEGNMTYVYVLSALAFLILIIAAANYMNLATARSITRSKEVGIRKVVGSFRRQLMIQFLVEAFIFVLLAFCLSLFLVEFFLPFFQDLIGKELTVKTIFELDSIWLTALILLILGLLSGLYPAVMLSSFNPVKVLKGKFSGNKQGILLRKSLIVFQFVISVIMISCTLLIFKQLDFIQQKDLGFNKEQLMIISLNDDFNNSKANSFREELLENPQIQNASLTNVVPSYNTWARNAYQYMSTDGLKRQVDLDDMPVGYDFLETMEMELLSGRNFSREIRSDSSKVCIVNAAFIEATGIQDPVGKTITSTYSEDRKLKIIGVVKDFHLHSFHNEVRPAILFIAPNPYSLVIRVKPENVSSTISHVEDSWASFTKKYPFEPKFLDVSFANLYETEQKQGKLLMSFSLLAILIAFLGIFGLVAFSMQQKRREIGIRKVLGASLQNIILLISKDFLRLVSLAIIIAVPITYYFAGQWLQNFAYKINLLENWHVFVLTAFGVISINFITTTFQALRTITLNPVDVLKDE